MSFHETVPPLGTRCGDPRCGRSTGQGHPRTGWIRIFVAGTSDPPVWYSSYECLAYSVALRPALGARATIWPRNRRRNFTVSEAIELLNRYSGYTLTTLGLTRVRIAYAYRHACARLIIDDPQYDDVRGALAACRGVLLATLDADSPAVDDEVDDGAVDEAVGY